MRKAVLCTALVLNLAGIGWAQVRDPSVVRIHNFSHVNDHLYRGAQPTPEGLRDLATAHVSLVIDLRQPDKTSEAERRLVQSLGMQYIGVPLPPTSAPSSEEVKRVLSLINPDDSGITFVHCWRGKDRTGTVVACYRIQHDGWTPQRALHEASQHGMSEFQRSMRSFILHFQPVDLPRTALLGAPPPLK